MSDYKREKMGVDGSWLDILPEGFELFKVPELPKVQFKTDGVKYECTDLRFLNAGAVNCFLVILGEISRSANCNEVGFDVAGVDESDINLIVDIVLGVRFGYSKGGKNGFSGEGSFIMGVRHEGSGDDARIVFEIPEDIADAIHRYANGKENVSYTEIVVAVGKDCAERLRNYGLAAC